MQISSNINRSTEFRAFHPRRPVAAAAYKTDIMQLLNGVANVTSN